MKNTELRLLKVFRDLTLIIGRVGDGYYWIDLTDETDSRHLLAQIEGAIAPSPERIYIDARDQGLSCGVLRKTETDLRVMPEAIPPEDTVILNDGDHAILRLFSDLRISFNRIGNGIAWIDITDPDSSAIMADTMLGESDSEAFNDFSVYETCLAQGIPCGFIRPMTMIL